MEKPCINQVILSYPMLSYWRTNSSGLFCIGWGWVNSCKQWLACLRVGEETPRVYLIQGRWVNSCKLLLACLRFREQTPMGDFFIGVGVNSCKLWLAYQTNPNGLSLGGGWGKLFQIVLMAYSYRIDSRGPNNDSFVVLYR